MFSVAICDDDEILCEKLESYMEEYIENNSIVCEVYYSAEKLYDDLLTGNSFDLIFLDIESMNGVVLGHKIREEMKIETMHIVYISAKQEHAMELFSVRPLNFLVKPITKRDVVSNLKKAMDLLIQSREYLRFQNGNKLYRIEYGDIVYFSTEKRKIQIYTVNGFYDFYGKLHEIQKKVPSNFIRIHKSYLVNDVYIKKWEYGSVSVGDKDMIPISPSYRKAVREILKKKWRED